MSDFGDDMKRVFHLHLYVECTGEQMDNIQTALKRHLLRLPCKLEVEEELTPELAEEMLFRGWFETLDSSEELDRDSCRLGWDAARNNQRSEK